MSLRWRDGVFVCEADGRMILLDVRTGRYAAPSRAAIQAMRQAGQGGVRAGQDLRPLEQLISSGLLVHGSSVGSGGPEALTAPDTQLWTGPDERARGWDLVVVIVARLVAGVTLRTLGFGIVYRLFARFGAAAAGGSPSHAHIISRFALAFARADLILARRDRCLSRSVAFRLVALWHGLDVRLVIGVRGSPFAAHCWAERNGAVLNDDLDVVRQFTPLLAV